MNGDTALGQLVTELNRVHRLLQKDVVMDDGYEHLLWLLAC